MNNYDYLLGLPDVNFTDVGATEIESSIISEYQNITKTVLYPGDPVRLFLTTLAYRIAHERNIYNLAARQTLLRYAEGDKLDHIGALVGCKRILSAKASVQLRFTLTTILSFDVVIPKGTRVSPKNSDAVFIVNEEVKIKSEEEYIDVDATSYQEGESFNGLLVGQIDTIIDPIAYVEKVENTSESSGGADVELDESYRMRISIAPESFSSAGPELAYKYHALSSHQNISSVSVGRSEPGVVLVTVLLKNGVIPDTDSIELKAVISNLNDDKIKPLTDTVDVEPATAVIRDFTITWYLSDSKSYLQSDITKNIQSAVEEYINWQTNELGRDINPDELVSLCKQAGAKRVEIDGLSFYSMSTREVCQFKENSQRIIFGGTERGN